ncbi:MAG: IclR family transcriptional regulator [Acidobacteria bacterium]|nr:IclR family transcriptional regulator [Acidobacteriota bacterium]
MAARNYVELVEKTLRVLEALSEGALHLKGIAARLGLVKSSVFRILYTLKELGYVEQTSPNGAYRLTVKALGLARSPALRPTLLNVVRPHLARLRDELQESVWLAELRGHMVLLVDVAEAAHRLRLSLDLGDACPLHASALGKAVAAWMPPEQLQAALGKAKLPAYTRKTVTRRSQVMAELARVRRQGYAVNEEETIDGAIVLGAPLFDARERAFAAISVAAPTARCTGRKRERMIQAVKRTAAGLSSELAGLGYRAGG